MSTTTVSRPLAEIYAERWRRGDQDPDRLADALGAVHDEMVGEYYQTETGDYPPLGNDWREKLEAAMEAAGERAFEEYVVPALAAAAVEFIRTTPPPEHLRVYHGSEQLRADLEAL